MSKKERFILEQSLRSALCNILSEEIVEYPEIENFILNDATYEQLLRSITKCSNNVPVDIMETAVLASIDSKLFYVEEGYSIYEILSKAREKLSKISKKHPNLATTGKVITGAAAISILASWLYYKYLSQYIRACSSIKNKDVKKLKNCILKVKISSYQKAIDELKRSMTSCKFSDYPDVCKREYEKEIYELNRKIYNLRKFISENSEFHRIECYVPRSEKTAKILKEKIKIWTDQLFELQETKQFEPIKQELIKKINIAKNSLDTYYRRLALSTQI